MTQSNHLQEELADMKGILKELETKIEEYQKNDRILTQANKDLCSACNDVEIENNNLRDERDKLQEENNHLIQKSHNDDYRNENMRKRVEDLGKTLTLYEKENKAMRELLRLWV